MKKTYCKYKHCEVFFNYFSVKIFLFVLILVKLIPVYSIN